MTSKSEFASFVERTIEEVVRLAEEYSHVVLPRTLKFRWLGEAELAQGDAIVETIVTKVYVNSENIYPCVDIGVGDLADDGSPIIVATVFGYTPRPFQKNWTGRDGPFVHIIGTPFLDEIAGKKSPSSKSFGFIIPDMKNLKKLLREGRSPG